MIPNTQRPFHRPSHPHRPNFDPRSSSGFDPYSYGGAAAFFSYGASRGASRGPDPAQYPNYRPPPRPNVTSRKNSAVPRKSSTSEKVSHSDDDLNAKLSDVFEELRCIRAENFQLRNELESLKIAFNVQASRARRSSPRRSR